MTNTPYARNLQTAKTLVTLGRVQEEKVATVVEVAEMMIVPVLLE